MLLYQLVREEYNRILYYLVRSLNGSFSSQLSFNNDSLGSGINESVQYMIQSFTILLDLQLVGQQLIWVTLQPAGQLDLVCITNIRKKCHKIIVKLACESDILCYQRYTYFRLSQKELIGKLVYQLTALNKDLTSWSVK